MQYSTQSRTHRETDANVGPQHVQQAVASYRLHLDSGANMLLTNDETKLINYWFIKPHAIARISDDRPVLSATGIEYLPWRANNGTALLVKCFHSPQAAEMLYNMKTFEKKKAAATESYDFET